MNPWLLFLGISVSAVGLAVIALIIRRILRGQHDADQLWTNQGRKLVPPRSPAKRRKL